ncbi:MAG: glycine zipper 2TM domain-containing protein [Betaproteobacteria bacterium]|nr:glycine zipper 2TM domain-containing protein [Betaproteobacteria bacterium]
MNPSSPKTSPLVVAASVAVIAFCVVGIAALLGVLPGRGKQPEAPAVTAQEPAGKPGESLLGPLPQPGHPVSRGMVPPPGSAPAPGMAPPPGSAPMPVCTTCGVITSIRLVERPGEATPLGMVAGGLLGGILGHQVGGGGGKDLATIAGAVGGGLAGREIEQRARSTRVHEITVRMEDGREHTFTQQANPAFVVGDRVRLVQGVLRPY